MVIIHLLKVNLLLSSPISGIMNAKSSNEPNVSDWLINLNLSTKAIKYADY